MVQIIPFLLPLPLPKHRLFISHMVQIIQAIKSPGQNDLGDFISHMVQIILVSVEMMRV